MSEMIERLISLGFSRSRARAAIAAMREPTEAMKHASTMIAPTWDDNISAEKWRAMIDVALGDDKRGMSKSAPSVMLTQYRGASPQESKDFPP